MTKVGSISLLAGLISGGVSDFCELGAPVLVFIATTILTLFFTFKLQVWIKLYEINQKIKE